MRRALYLTAAVFCGGLLTLALGQHQVDDKGEKRHPFVGNEEAIAVGRRTYLSSCAACHGQQGEGGRGPSLLERNVWHPLPDEALYQVIQKGVGGMPGSDYPEERAWQVVAFVRSMTAPANERTLPGDAAAGQQLFWGSGQCGSCHRVQGKGGFLGPDLSLLASVSGATQIRKAIAEANERIAPGYQGVEVQLWDGTKLRGVARNRTNYALQLLTAEGNLHLLEMAQVKELTVLRDTLMPQDYAKRFSTKELDDLVAYLAKVAPRRVTTATATAGVN